MLNFSVDPEIAKARTLSSEFYLRQDVFELCRERIFAPSWQFMGDSDQVSRSGDVHPVVLLEDYLSEPLLLTRDKDMRIHLISNVCTHRGNTIAKEACSVRNLYCQYHGRVFDLNGKFRSMPEFNGVENFPSDDDNLAQLPLYSWGKWLFTSLNPKFSAEAYMNDMIDRLCWLPVEDFKFRPELSHTFEVDVHWALYCENFLEGFHIPFVHKGLNSTLEHDKYSTELFKYSNVQLGIARHTQPYFDLPESSIDHGKRIAAYYFFVFPNTMFNFYPWGLSLNIVEPVSTSKSRVRFLTYMWKEELFNTGAGSNLKIVEMEDEKVVKDVQIGIRSRFYKQGRYSPTREQGTHHFHRLLAEFIG